MTTTNHCRNCKHLLNTIDRLEEDLEAARQRRAEEPKWLTPLPGLTGATAAILQLLLERPNASRELLYRSTREARGHYPDDHIASHKVIDVHVSRLRRWTRQFGIDITNVFGLGYRCVNPAEGARLLQRWRDNDTALLTDLLQRYPRRAPTGERSP